MTDPKLRRIISERAKEIHLFYKSLGQTKILDRGIWRDRTAEDDWYQAEREFFREEFPSMESEWKNV